MATNVNCTQFRNGLCYHQAAPRGLFGACSCILWMQADPRIEACGLQDMIERPKLACVPPPRVSGA